YSIGGAPGAGKTILASQICFSHLAREPGGCVYLTLLVESHAKLVRHLSSLSFFRAELVPDRMTFVSGYDALRSGGLDALLGLIRRCVQDQKATMLAIDGLESALHFSPDVRAFREFINAVQAATGLFRCTTLLLTSSAGLDLAEKTLVDGIIELSDTL